MAKLGEKKAGGGIAGSSRTASRDTVLRGSNGATYNYATGERSGSRYTDAQVSSLNAAREKNVSEGRSAESGAGAMSTINANSLQGNSLIKLPEQKPVSNQMGTLFGANASVVNPAMGVTAGQNGLLEYNQPQTPTTANTAENTFQQYLNSIQGLQNEAPSSEATYNKLYKDSGLRDIDSQISSLTGQINNITAKAQAESLGLEGQGRGITESIIGGQQAQISREAAIQALPLQALLANAQGNKELAQTHLDTRFKLQMEDAQNRFEYKTKLIDAVYSFADKQEQRRLEEIRRKEDMDFDLKKGDIAFERQKYMEQIGTENSLKLQQASFANSVKLRQMEIDAKNEEENPPASTLALAQAKGNIDNISSLLGGGSIKTAVGPNFLSRLSFTEPFTARRGTAIADIQKITSQLTLDKLVQAKAAGATFGSLTEGERQELANAASKINTLAVKDKNGNVTGYKTTEATFRKEFDTIINFAKIDYIMKGGNPQDVGVQQMPDGSYTTRNSDGTYTILD